MQARWRQLYSTHAALAGYCQRVDRAHEDLRRFLMVAERPYVSFSGGKDSLCLLLLLHDLGRQDVPVFTQADDLDWPHKRAFCHATVDRLGFCDYTYAESAVSAVEQFAGGDVIRGTFSHVVQAYVANRERTGVVIGLRQEESPGRFWTIRTHGSLVQIGGVWRGLPLARWTGRDVFALIVARQAPYFDLYDHDETCPPHELRMSWPANPQFLSRGAATVVKRHYPDVWRRLCAVRPELRAHA